MDEKKYVLYFILLIALSSFSQILLKISAKKNYDNVIKRYLNVYVICGYSFFLSCILGASFIYKYLDLKVGIILDNLSFLFVVLLSRLFLKEKIEACKIKYFVLIVVGVVIFMY